MKVLFVHDTGVHFSHAAWAESVGADFVDYNPGHKYPPFLIPLQSTFKARKIEQRYDVVLAEGGTCLPLAVKIKKKFGSKLIFFGEDAMFWEFETMPNAPRNIYLKKQIKYIDGVVADSKVVKEYAEKFVDCPIIVVHPAGNVDVFGKFRPGLRTKNILFFGKHRPDKNIEGIIEYYRDVKKEIPESRLTLIGAHMRDRLPSELRKTNGLTIIDHINFRTKEGFNEMKQHIANSRIFTHISPFDPCPVAVTEAMCAGLPPLITRGVGNSDFVPEELVFEDNFAKHAIDLLNKPYPKIKRLSERCRKLGMKHNKKHTMMNFKKAFFDIIENRKKYGYYC